jgi:hypothetical protein
LAKLVRLGKQMKEAILMVLKYVKNTTGIEPTQKEIANAVNNYFMLNEIGNQIKFQRKNPVPQEQQPVSSESPFWRLNLMEGPAKNSLVRVGLFDEDIQVALQAARSFVKNSSGEEPSEEDLAQSLKCNFILSELKNQIAWQRKSLQKNKKAKSIPR